MIPLTSPLFFFNLGFSLSLTIHVGRATQASLICIKLSMNRVRAETAFLFQKIQTSVKLDHAIRF